MRQRDITGKFTYSGAMQSYICKYCNNPFPAYGTRKYCGRPCSLKAYHEERKRQNKPNLLIKNGHSLNWKGGRHVMTNGYIRIWVPGRGYCYEHRIIMEKKIGRRLERTEVVHHRDGIKTNNDEDNLLMLPKRDHDRYETNRRHKEGWNQDGSPCRTRRKFTDSDAKEFMRLFMSGQSMRQIAILKGVSHDVISHEIQRAARLHGTSY